MKKLLVLPGLLALLAGCGDSTAINGEKAETTGAERVVVAVLDTAFNPYQSFFYETSSARLKSPIYPAGAGPSAVTPEVLAEFGIDQDHILEVTRTSKFSADIKTDEALWAKVKRGELYWFKGTNVLAISFSGNTLPYLQPINDKNPHGTGTSGSVLTANPEAIVLFVETYDTLGGQEPHGYAFNHPLVDIVSTSYGYGVGIPGVGGTGLFPPEPNAFFSSFRGVVRLGKMHFSSGGNMPGSTPHRGGAGPWWSIGVSGFEEGSSEGRTVTSGHFPDFVSDFTQTLPYCLDCEAGTESVGGTSFSTPRSAGTASRVLLEARRALGHSGGIRLSSNLPVMAEGAGRRLTNWDLRRALELGAYVPTTADYNPGIDPPINDEAPWLQVAWGEISALPAKGVIAESLAALGLGTSSRTKDAAFCDFQTKIIEERHVYWDTLSPEFDFLYDENIWPTISPLLAQLVNTVPAVARDYAAYAAGYLDLRGDPSEAVADPFVYCGSTLPSP